MVNNLLYKEIIERMNEYQDKVEYDTLGTEILLLALMSIEDSMTNLILKELDVTKEDILKIINSLYFIRDDIKYTYTLKKVFERAEELQKNKDYVYDEAYLYSILENENCIAMYILSSLQIEGNQISEELVNALSYLEEDDKILINLTKLAKNNELNKLVGRQDILNSIDNILSKKQKNNCMLIGPAGVGKSGIVEGLANYYLEMNKEYTIYQLDIGSLISGTRYRGDLEEKVMEMIERIQGKNNILFIDEIHNIINNNANENSIDIANLLKPYLARSSIKCIGATTTEEYYKTIGKDKALSRRFKNIIVNEPNEEETIKILMGIKNEYEQFYGIKYSKDIIEKIVYSSSYFHNLNNPDKSIDILDECGTITKKKNQKTVNINTVKQVIYNGLGLNIINCNQLIKKCHLENKIIKDLKNYLDLKTSKYISLIETTKENKKKILNEIIDILNLNNENILELDLNDYLNEYSISTLLGTSPGYVGYDDGGILSKQILRHNINIIVFNNYNDKQLINKKIIDKIINNGYLLDYQGNKLNFINTVIIFTTEKNKKIGFN